MKMRRSPLCETCHRSMANLRNLGIRKFCNRRCFGRAKSKSMTRYHITPWKLRRLYWDQGLGLKATARHFGCSFSNVRYHLVLYGMESHPRGIYCSRPRRRAVS